MKKNFLLYLIIFILIIASDRITKSLVKSNLKYSESIKIVNDYIRLTYLENEGIAFSMFNNSGKFFLFFSPIILCLIIFYFFKYEIKNVWTNISFTLIIAGAAGNIIDRFVWGRVVDFIDVDIPDIILPFFQLHRWPVFNIADSSISVGIVLLIIYSLFISAKEPCDSSA